MTGHLSPARKMFFDLLPPQQRTAKHEAAFAKLPVAEARATAVTAVAKRLHLDRTALGPRQMIMLGQLDRAGKLTPRLVAEFFDMTVPECREVMRRLLASK